MLRDNLDATTSVTGVPRKLSAGLVFAQAVKNPRLESELRGLGPVESDPRVEALARAIAPSPALVDDTVVEAARSLAPAEIVELVTFVSVMQLVHRIDSFYAAA
jgi:hypothetical protein